MFIHLLLYYFFNVCHLLFLNINYQQLNNYELVHMVCNSLVSDILYIRSFIEAQN